jgi:Fe-S-cluster containining protein
MAALHQGMVSLASSIRHDIQERARRQVAAMEIAFPRLKGSPSLGDWSDAEVDLVVERFADFPCPALDSEGSCRVYPFRPATCRTMGIPLDENGHVHGACEIQTAVPIVRLPRALREEEDKIAALEAAEIRAEGNSRDRISVPNAADEVLLAYGFLPE